MNIVKESHLGSGGYGDVYRTIDKNNNDHTVALKIMAHDYANIRSSVVREFINIQRFDHPNILKVDPLVYNDGTRHPVFINKHQGRVELSLELLDGDIGNLPITKDILRKMTYDVTSGLFYMHSLGYIHNDLKPANVLYKLENGVYTFKIADFGLSQYMGIPFPSRVTDFLSTAIVKAPNALSSSYYIRENRYNYNSDMFSLGATMFWVCMKKNNVSYNDFGINEHEIFVDIRTPKFLLHTSKLTEMYGEDGYDFIIKCLEPKSKNRLSSKKALNHPYLKGIRGGAISNLFKKIETMYKQPSLEDYIEGLYELEYIEDMYNNYKDGCINLYVDIKKQTGGIAEHMKTIVFEWLYECVDRFNTASIETYFQTMLIIVKYLNIKTDIAIDKLQLTAISALSISNKINSYFYNSEIEVDNYKWILANKYTEREIIEKEQNILNSLDLKLPFTPIMFFLNYWYLKSIYTHENKKPNLGVLSTSVALMVSIFFSNNVKLSDVPVDSLAKYCVKKAIQLQNYTDSSNIDILDIDDSLNSILDNIVDNFDTQLKTGILYTIKQIIKKIDV